MYTEFIYKTWCQSIFIMKFYFSMENMLSSFNAIKQFLTLSYMRAAST